jgi:hypothetical protein
VLRAAVGNAYYDRLIAGAAQILHGLVDLPLAGETGGLVEEILAVVHIQHWVARLALVVPRREVDQDVAGALDIGTPNLFQHLHGAGNRMRAHVTPVDNNSLKIPGTGDSTVFATKSCCTGR